jgi:hypothetical protein
MPEKLRCIYKQVEIKEEFFSIAFKECKDFYDAECVNTIASDDFFEIKF